MTLRLNKFLAERLGISRREADDFIAAGKVFVNDGKATLGARIEEKDKVVFNKKEVPFETRYIYLAFNKPVGFVCSRKRQGDVPTIYEILPKKYQDLKTVGRLDKDSSGLILLTNDGDFAFRMTHPKFSKTKVYEVLIDRKLEPLHQQMIADFGIEIGDGVSRLGLTKLNEGRDRWEVLMSEGRNRQIRRTFAALGYKVVELERKQFGPYILDGLKPGEFLETKKV